MAGHTATGLAKYDLDQVMLLARRRFVEDYDTVTLLKMAQSDREKEQIILICTVGCRRGAVQRIDDMQDCRLL